MTELQKLSQRSLTEGSRLAKRYQQLEEIFEDINNRELTETVVEGINEQVTLLNNAQESELRKQLRKSRTKILAVLEKEMKVVVINHYMLRWMAIGMTVFGVSIGVAYGTAIGNMGLMGAGIAIGMSVGLAIGAGMDKKAKDEGRQINVKLS